jgi:hypothetical protein
MDAKDLMVVLPDSRSRSSSIGRQRRGHPDETAKGARTQSASAASESMRRPWGGRGNLPGSKRVLGVDDDLGQHAVLRVLPGRYGYETAPAAPLSDARAVLSLHVVQCIIGPPVLG